MINENGNIPFPAKDKNKLIQIPPISEMRPGDILIARYDTSEWAEYFPWEGWHHAALISEIYPLKIIEAAGPNKSGQNPGPAEVLFNDSVGFGNAKDILEILWLKPIFPKIIRRVDLPSVPLSKRQKLSEAEARIAIVQYARNQLGEKYSVKASKWDENFWYCSLLIYKCYSRTISGMYLETSDSHSIRNGYYVTPEDLIKSHHTYQYFSWKWEGQQNIQI